MNSILEKKSIIFDIKHKVENKDHSLFNHIKINNNVMDVNTVSIVMTSSNRSTQTYYTLKTIDCSLYKNIQVIIVDDSTTDPICEEFLKNAYSFNIDLIQINRENKNWHNPLVNYNIGFTFIEGGKIIIQNAEVCHVGDVISFVNQNIQNNHYYSFDVCLSSSFDSNTIVYYSNISNISIYRKPISTRWAQNKDYNKNYHYLTAITSDTFSKIKNFSYDCIYGSDCDDDDFVLKIASRNIDFYNVFHDMHNVGGIHLYHTPSKTAWNNNVECNLTLVNGKYKYYILTREYIDITENIEEFDEKYNKIYNI